MLRNKYIKAAAEAINRVPSLCCSTIDVVGYPDIRVMRNLRSKYIYPEWESFFKNDFNSYIPINTFSTKLLQITKHDKACLFYFDVTTDEEVILTGSLEIVTDKALKQKFWRDTWLNMFPDGIDGEEYSLLFFACDRVRYYNACAGDIYDSQENEDRKIYHDYYGKQ